jgi:hypothetical protein
VNGGGANDSFQSNNIPVDCNNDDTLAGLDLSKIGLPSNTYFCDKNGNRNWDDGELSVMLDQINDAKKRINARQKSDPPPPPPDDREQIKDDDGAIKQEDSDQGETRIIERTVETSIVYALSPADQAQLQALYAARDKMYSRALDSVSKTSAATSGVGKGFASNKVQLGASIAGTVTSTVSLITQAVLAGQIADIAKRIDSCEAAVRNIK